MIPETDRERRERLFYHCSDKCGGDLERSLTMAERIWWFISGEQSAAPVLSLPAPAIVGADFAAEPDRTVIAAVEGDGAISDVVEKQRGAIADEATAIVESAREIQRASKGAVERAEKAVKPRTRRKAATQRLWTEEEDATVTRMTREGRKAAEIAAKIDRTAKAVELRRATLGVKGHQGRPRKAEQSSDPVADFIARNGVTRCPTAAVAPTEGATIPDADRRALQERPPVEYRSTIAAYFTGGRARAHAPTKTGRSS
jgi:hypothetical protein